MRFKKETFEHLNQNVEVYLFHPADNNCLINHTYKINQY